MKVKVISVLEDNYMYLVIEESTRDAIAVDAAVPKRLLEIIRKEDVVLRAILTTHHHWDHARGNEELARLCPGLRVYGADERIGALTHKVTHEQELTFGAIRVRCLFTPCHTSGHMCYFMWEDGSPDAPALFSGDTLFVGGCGKFFEGTAEQIFYPPDVTVLWLHNGDIVNPGDKSPSLVPNGDLTYQTQLTLMVAPAHGDTFTCSVQHPSLEQPLLVDWGPGLSPELTVKVVAAALVLVLGLSIFAVGVHHYRDRSRAPGYTPLAGDTHPTGSI